MSQQFQSVKGEFSFKDGGKKYACSEVQIKESDFGDEDEYQEELVRLGRFAVCENLFKWVIDLEGDSPNVMVN